MKRDALGQRGLLGRWALLGAALVGGVAGIARGQLVAPAAIVAADSGEVEEPQNKNQGFSVLKEDQKHIEALDDFSRFASKKQWELAFKAIAPLTEGDLKGMVPAKDGFYVPVTLRIRMLLAGLPPEGKEAYRLFYDAKAKQMLEKVKEGEEGVARVNELRKIVDEYFITSVGDQAADTLGDLYFERGDFVAAARAWDSILANYPDSSISKLKLHVKKAVALMRAGQRDAFGVEAELIKDQFPGQSIVVGGREMSASEFLSGFEKMSASTRPAKGDDEPLVLPESDTPQWQMEFVDDATRENMRQALQNMGWNGQMMAGMTGSAPPSGTDGKRVYVNWLGITFALDAKTGKLLWRTNKFSELAPNFQQMVSYMVDVDRYALKVVGEDVIVNSVPMGQWNRGMMFQLTCYEGATGKVKWSSSTGTLQSWSFVGDPLLIGQNLYIEASQQGNQEAHLLAIEAGSGKLLWEMALGTPQSGTNYRGEAQIPQPSMIYHEGTLYVLTNNGAMLAVDLSGRKIDWALTYPMPPVSNQQMWGWQAPQKAKDSTGVAVIRGGIMYIKEAGGSTMYAVDLGGPSLKWKRPVEDGEMIAELDDHYMYFVGKDVSAMDMATRELKWSMKLPQQCTVNPLLAGKHLYVSVGRGIFELDTKNGDTVRIFRGADKESEGGKLYRASDKLICVSNLAVTAYPTKAASTARVGK